jgi:hypothetical protein
MGKGVNEFRIHFAGNRSKVDDGRLPPLGWNIRWSDRLSTLKEVLLPLTIPIAVFKSCGKGGILSDHKDLCKFRQGKGFGAGCDDTHA